MKEYKRPELVGGLTITTIGVLAYIIASILGWKNEVIPIIAFVFSIIILFINIKAFYTVNLSEKEFKKQMVWPWVSFSLILIYILYLIFLMIYTFNTNGTEPNILIIAICIVFFLSLILYILGILKKVIDKKITYEEHLNQTKTEK